jgi:hypothetical protein
MLRHVIVAVLRSEAPRGIDPLYLSQEVAHTGLKTRA